MSDLALLMLKPDAVLQRLTGPALDWLADRGFAPLRYRQLHLTPQLRGRLYETTRVGGHLDWELNAVLYTLGPVRAVLLTHDHDDPAYLSGSLKGSFLPSSAHPGTLRHDIGALNPICNLIHSADDEARVRREAEILFGARTPDADGPGLVALDAARTEVPTPTPLWPTVQAVVTSLVGPWGDLPWPDADAGPTRDALRTAAGTLTELAAMLQDRAAAALLSGARTGTVGHGAWDERAGPRRGWDTYLAYTTVRYLDLCLDAGHVA